MSEFSWSVYFYGVEECRLGLVRNPGGMFGLPSLLLSLRTGGGVLVRDPSLEIALGSEP